MHILSRVVAMRLSSCVAFNKAYFLFVAYYEKVMQMKTVTIDKSRVRLSYNADTQAAVELVALSKGTVNAYNLLFRRMNMHSLRGGTCISNIQD